MQNDDVIQLYLDLIKKCLTGMIFEDVPKARVVLPGYVDREPKEYLKSLREYGRDIPSQAHSMIGLNRMDNIQFCIEQVLRDGIPGDLLEAGVWRGGAVIFMRAVLKAYQVTDRVVWAADSFAGMPATDPEKFPEDSYWTSSAGGIPTSLAEVKKNFSHYGLLDEQVRFLVGWFKDTLPNAPIERLAVRRLDGDLYESTIDTITNLYPKLAVRERSN